MLRGTVEYTGWMANPTRAMRRAMQTASLRAVQLWHSQSLPAHFETSAPSRYGYAKRTRGYMIRKARKWHHQKPLVWSGQLRREVLRTIKTSPTRRGAKGVLQGPRYLYMYNPAAKVVDKAAEIVATDERDRRQLARWVEAYFPQRMNQETGSTGRRAIRGGGSIRATIDSLFD